MSCRGRFELVEVVVMEKTSEIFVRKKKTVVRKRGRECFMVMAYNGVMVEMVETWGVCKER